MNEHYVEVLVKRNLEKEKKNRKILGSIPIVLTGIVWLMTRSILAFTLCVFVIYGYYQMVVKYCVEYEYFYMDGELIISKIINKSRRKSILEINDGLIKMVAPVNSTELEKYKNLEKKDYTANDFSKTSYSIVYADKGQWKIVDIQMAEELYIEMKRNMPYKVKKN